MKTKQQTNKWLWPLLLLFFAFLAWKCDSKEEFEIIDGYETLQLSEWNDEWNEYLEEPWYQYKTYKNQKGVILKTLDGTLGISIYPDQEYASMYLVNISQNQLTEGMEIIFSGEIRDSPLVNLSSYILVLKNIQIKKNIVIQ